MTDSFTCPTCGATSYNPNDVREGYCGRCHEFTGSQASASKPANKSASLPAEVGKHKDQILTSMSSESSDPYFIVVIDDERVMPERLTPTPVMLVKTSDDGIALLEEFRASGVHLDELWLDHDLGYDSSKPYGWDTIMPVVNWLEELGAAGTPLDVGLVLVHTANPAAAPQMLDALRPYYHVARVDFPL